MRGRAWGEERGSPSGSFISQWWVGGWSGVDNLFNQTERSPELTATEYTDTHRLSALVPTIIQCLCMFD